MIDFLAKATGNNFWIAKTVTENSIVRVRGKVGRLTNVRRKRLLLVYDSKCERGMSVSPDERVEVLKYSAALAADWLAEHTDGEGNLIEPPAPAEEDAEQATTTSGTSTPTEQHA